MIKPYQLKPPHVCTKENPWNRDAGGKAIHPDAVLVGDQDYGSGEYCVCYKCPHCGKYFEVEQPQ